MTSTQGAGIDSGLVRASRASILSFCSNDCWIGFIGKVHNPTAKMATRAEQYQQIKSTLLSAEHVFLSLPTSPATVRMPQKAQPGSLATIASLSLHPSLEATLHILNLDLPSAHFLLRHAQSPPAWECMYLHGILHRIEGDVQNARCWYSDVKDSELLNHVWKASGPSWEEFLDRVERLRDVETGRKTSDTRKAQTDQLDWNQERNELQRISLHELREVLSFLEDKFGTGQVLDASGIWIQPGGKVAEQANAMIVGGEGWRQF